MISHEQIDRIGRAQRSEDALIRAIRIDELKPADLEQGRIWTEAIRHGAVTELVGEPGVGKTTFGYDLAVALARAASFLGSPILRSCTVLYIDIETPHALAYAKWNTITAGAPEGISVFVPYSELPRDPEAFLSAVIHLVDEHAVDVVVIDPLSLAVPVADENAEGDVSEQMDVVLRLARERDVAVLFTHHPPKGRGGQAGVYVGRGSSVREARADIVLALRRKGSNRLAIELRKSRYCRPHLIAELDAGDDGAADAFPESDTKAARALRFVEACVRDAGTTGCSTKEILTRGNSAGITTTTLQRAIKRVVQVGSIRRVGKGRYVCSTTRSAMTAAQTSPGRAC